MKKILVLFIYLINLNSYSQDTKETVYLLFDQFSEDLCQIQVEQTYNNPKGIEKLKKYRKETKRGKTVFHICDEKFLFDPQKQKKDTCIIKSSKEFNFTELDYIKEKYQNGQDFKHHVFEEIIILERVSDTKFIRYYDVYWCCEWTIE